MTPEQKAFLEKTIAPINERIEQLQKSLLIPELATGYVIKVGPLYLSIHGEKLAVGGVESASVWTRYDVAKAKARGVRNGAGEKAHVTSRVEAILASIAESRSVVANLEQLGETVS